MNENFISEIDNMVLNKKDNLLIKAINLGIDKEIIFNALRHIYLIAHNAQIIKIEDELKGNFLFQDIDNSKERVKKLIEGYQKKGYDYKNAVSESFNMLKQHYLTTAEGKEISERTGFFKNDNNSGFGLVGTYYDFNIISDDIFEEIKERIINQ